MTGSTQDDVEIVSETTKILIRALRELGKSGQPDTANRLAARAWSALRHNHPREAEHVNGLMHFLARLPESHEVAPHTLRNRSNDEH